MAFVEPSSVTQQWELKLGAPLHSPHFMYSGYLGAIFTGVLKNGLPFTVTWASQREKRTCGARGAHGLVRVVL